MTKNSAKLKVKIPKVKQKPLRLDLSAGVMVPFAPPLEVEVGEAKVPSGMAEEIINPLIQEYLDLMPKAATALKNRLDLAISASVWDWPKGGPRDIIDTRKLKNSGSVTWNGKSLVINYTAPYADIVHDGGYIFPYGNKNARPIYLPGRPWVSAVLNGGGPVPRWDLTAWLDANAGGLIG